MPKVAVPSICGALLVASSSGSVVRRIGSSVIS